MAPTDPATMFLYYPDWSSDGVGCINDGNEPDYMSRNPSDYLHSTLDSCCSTYFSWNYNKCMGILPGICARSLFYPDWQGANEGCVDDGNEPAYMTDNHMSYMYTHLADCCKEHYQWNYDECVGRAGKMHRRKWYPDWEGGEESYCKTGGGQPTYMNNSPETWLVDTQVECCQAYFEYDYTECVGTAAASPNSPGFGKYYPNWLGADHVCKNDGRQPAYMSKVPDNWMFDTLEQCCTKHYSWNYQKCIGQTTSSNPSSGRSSGTSGGTGKFYVHWASDTCRQDCPSGGICGGVAESWDVLYDTLKECCSKGNSWNEDCENP